MKRIQKIETILMATKIIIAMIYSAETVFMLFCLSAFTMQELIVLSIFATPFYGLWSSKAFGIDNIRNLLGFKIKVDKSIICPLGAVTQMYGVANFVVFPSKPLTIDDVGCAPLNKWCVYGKLSHLGPLHFMSLFDGVTFVRKTSEATRVWSLYTVSNKRANGGNAIRVGKRFSTYENKYRLPTLER